VVAPFLPWGLAFPFPSRKTRNSRPIAFHDRRVLQLAPFFFDVRARSNAFSCRRDEEAHFPLPSPLRKF